MSPADETSAPADEEAGILPNEEEPIVTVSPPDDETNEVQVVTPVEDPDPTEPPMRELEDESEDVVPDMKDRQVRINVPEEEIPMQHLDPRIRGDDEMSVGSKTTIGSGGGRRKKVRHFNLTDLNRYGTIESTYLCENDRKERIENTDHYVNRVKDIHFITQSEVDSMKKALRIQITEDYEGVPEMISKIKIRVCNTYVPDKKGPAGPSGDPLCFCGKPKEAANHQAFSESKHWKSSKHTREVKTNAWGKVALSGCQANFLRLAEDTALKRVEELLMSVYKMKKPGVLISVLGSTSELEMSDKLEDEIERCLPKAAAACDAWLFTPGVNGGCGKLVGNGIRTYGLSLYTVGIVAWSSIHDRARKRMVDQTNDLGNAISYPTNVGETDIRHLEQNHTTFLMVDNGREDLSSSIEAATEFRIKFENHMKKSADVPVISVLNRGGFKSVPVISSRLNDNDTVIVLAKSAGLASFIQKLKEHCAWVSKKVDSSDKKHEKKKKEKESCCCVEAGGVLKADLKSCIHINRKLNKHLNMDKQSVMTWEMMYRFSELCVQRASQIFIYDVRSKVEFDQLLLDAMVENDSGVAKKLEYAFELGTVEVVESMLNDSAERLRSKTLTNLIMKAIIMNRPKMVKLFLNTCQKSQLLQLKFNMPVLYDSALYSYGGGHLVRLITYWVSDGIIPGAKSLGIYPNEGENQESVEEGALDQSEERTFNSMWNNKAIRLINLLINQLAGDSFDSSVGCEEDPFMELTIWSVMMLRKEMALMFCKRAEEPIRCALLCLKLMTQMEKRKNVLVNTEEDEKLSEMKMAFESLAICTLEACYSENPEMTFAAARARWKRVKNYDYLELAFEAESKRFIAHPACQDISEKRWRVGFVKDEGFWKVLMICIFPPLILLPGLIEFDVFANRHQDGKERAWWDKAFVRFKIVGKSPMIKFWMNAVFSLVFLILHLRVLYLDTKPVINPNEDKLSWPFIILLFVWFCLLVIDEIIQIFTEKLFYWWKNVWNRLDMINFLIFFIGLVLCMAFICTDDSGHCSSLSSKVGKVDGSIYCTKADVCDPDDAVLVHVGRMMLSIVTVILALRWSVFITSDLTLGPIVLMLFEMATTFANFFVIFCVVLLGFGAAYIGLLVEVGTFSMKRNIIGMVYYTYFQSLGELFLENLESPGSYYLTNNPKVTESWYLDSDVNVAYYYVTLFLLVTFMIISNLMLLNILIAMFTESYEKISSNQKTIWKFQRYSLLKDYESKYLPVPLNIIHYPLSFTRWFWKKFHPKNKYINPLRKSIDKHLRAFVKEGLQSFLKQYGERQEEDASSAKFAKYAQGL